MTLGDPAEVSPAFQQTETLGRGAVFIQSKVRQPPLGEQVVSRPRLDELLAGLIASQRLVAVIATAGSGKTTAVIRALSTIDRPLAWLTVDHTDAAPGRLVTYLEAALSRQVPEVAGLATGALVDGLPHAEAAGLLAAAVRETPVVLVLDELERLGDTAEAWAVIDAFVRYASPTMRIVLVSRRDIPARAMAQTPASIVPTLGEEALAFTAAEASQALIEIGKPEVDPALAVEATGGWVAGVLFEAWRSADHVAGSGGEADALHGYLAAQIIDQLDSAERSFLVETSLLDEVARPRAEALGQRDAARHLASLRHAHLPVSWTNDGSTLRCHPRFRGDHARGARRGAQRALVRAPSATPVARVAARRRAAAHAVAARPRPHDAAARGAVRWSSNAG